MIQSHIAKMSKRAASCPVLATFAISKSKLTGSALSPTLIPDSVADLLNVSKSYAIKKRSDTSVPRALPAALQSALTPYVFTSTKRVADAPTTQQIQRALKGEVGPRMTLSPHYNKLRSPTALTRQQYRHLAKSLRLLNDNDIIHGDLVDNVMLDAKTNLPVIIDFDEARVNSDKVLKAFQLGVLGREFKVAPKRQLKFVDS